MQVFPQGVQGIAAQAIVAAQFNDHQRRLVLLQQARQAAQSTGGGLAADAGIDHLPWRVLLSQLLRQQGHPALLQRHTVGGTDTIAQHQHTLGPGLRRPGQAQAEQSKQERRPYIAQKDGSDDQG